MMAFNIWMVPHVATLHTYMLELPIWHLDTFERSYSSKCPNFRVILANFHYRFLRLHFVFCEFEVKILWILWSQGSHFVGLYKSYPEMCQLPIQVRFIGDIWPIKHRQAITDKKCPFLDIFLIFQKSNPVDANFTVLAVEPVGRT